MESPPFPLNVERRVGKAGAATNYFAFAFQTFSTNGWNN